MYVMLRCLLLNSDIWILLCLLGNGVLQPQSSTSVNSQSATYCSVSQLIVFFTELNGRD